MLNFVPNVGVEPNSVITSAPVTLTTYQTLTITGGTLVVNGLPVSSPYAAQANDQVSVRVTSSASYSSAVFAKVTSTTDQDISVYFALTKASSDWVIYPSLRGINPLFLSQYANGTPYVPDIVDNAYAVYSTNGTLLNRISLDTATSGTATPSGYYVLTDYFAKKVYLFSTDNVLLAEKTYSDPVYGGDSTGWAADPENNSIFWISIPAQNRVVGLDNSLTEVVSYTLGSSPMGISSINPESPSSKLAICSSGDNTLLIVDSNTGSITQTIAVPGKPFEVLVSGSKAFVSLTDTAHLAVVDLNSYAVTSVSLPDIASGLSSRNSKVYICAVDRVVELDTNTLASRSVRIPGTYLFSSAVKDNYLYAVDLNGSTVQVLDLLTLAKVDQFSTERKPYSILVSGGSLVVGILYDNTPTLMFTPDTVPKAFGLSDSLLVPRNFAVQTSSILVDDVYPGVPIPVSVPDIYGAQIIKNGIGVGASTTAVRDDVVSLSFLTPVEGGVSIRIPLIIGTVYDTFDSSTALVDATPDPFEFVDLTDQTRSTYVLSNSVTLSGMDSDAVVVISAAPASAVLYKNGSSLGTNFGSFSNGDTLRVGMVTPSGSCDVVGVTVTAGDYTTVWTLTTAGRTDYFILDQYLATPLTDLPTVGGVAVTSNDALAYVSTSLTGSVGRTYLNATPTGSAEQQDYLTLLDKAKNTIYLIDPTTQSIVKAYVAPHPISSVDYYPKYAPDGTTPTHLVLGVKGVAELILLDSSLDYLGQVTLTDEVSALYVTSESILITAHKSLDKVARYSISGDSFTYMDSVSSASPDFLYEDELSNTLLIGSSTNRVLTVTSMNLVPQVTVAEIVPQGVAIDVANSKTFIADTYSNSVRVFNMSYVEIGRIELSGPPSDIFLDSSKLYVSNVKDNTVSRIDSSTGVVEATVGFNSTVLGLSVANGVLYVLESVSNLDLVSTTSQLTPMSNFSLPLQDGVPVGSVVTSPSITVTGLVRPVKFYAEAYPGVTLLVNGVDKGSATSYVWNGDEVAVREIAPAEYYTQRDLRIGACGVSSIFSVRTEPNLTPDQMLFAPLYDQYVDSLAMSSSVTISGLTPGFSTVLDLDFGTTVGGAYVNGELYLNDTITVTNGDVVRLVILVQGPYGALRNYYVLRLSNPVGHIKVVTITLEGALPWPTFAQRKYEFSPLVVEEDIHVFDSGIQPISRSTSEAVYSALASESLGTPLFKHGLTTPTSITWPQSLGPTLGPKQVPPLIRTLVEADLSTQEVLNKFLVTIPMVLQSVVEPLLRVTSLDAGLTADPEHYVIPYRTYDLNIGEYLQGLLHSVLSMAQTKLVYDMTKADLPRMYVQSFNWTSLPIQYLRGPVRDCYVLPMGYEWAQYLGKYFRDMEYAQVPLGTVAYFDPVFIRNPEFNYLYYEMQTLNLVYEIHSGESSGWSHVRHSFTLLPYLEAVAQVFRYGVGLFPVGSPLHTVGSQKEVSTGTPVYLSYFLKYGIQAQGINVQEWPLELIFLSARATNHNFYIRSGLEARLDQDSVSYCPPYGTCYLKGLYPSLSEAFAAAQADSDRLRPLTAVPFKGCYLWIEDPVLEIVQCASVGPNDPFIIPYAWNLSQGPLKVARTQLKVSRYLNGG